MDVQHPGGPELGDLALPEPAAGTVHATADPVLEFEDTNVVPAAGQFQSGRQTGEPGPENYNTLWPGFFRPA